MPRGPSFGGPPGLEAFNEVKSFMPRAGPLRGPARASLVINYRVAGQLKRGNPLPSNLHEIAVGLILGDAHIFRNKTENASMHIEQSFGHKEYVFHLYDLFSDYCKSPPVTRTRVNNKLDTSYISIRFTTRQLSCFTQLHELFYDANKTKIIPNNISEFISPVTLADWSMDDGSKQGKGFHLNTQSYTLEETSAAARPMFQGAAARLLETKILSDVLFNKFNLNNSIQSHKNGYRIYIKVNSKDNFIKLVKPYFHPSMLYKLS